MLTRRSLLLGAVCAPAVVRAESLMKIWVPPVREVWQWRPGDYEIPWSALFPQVGLAMLMRAEEARNREMREWLEATRISRARIEKDYVTPWISLFPRGRV